jgi:hypothetical protein
MDTQLLAKQQTQRDLAPSSLFATQQGTGQCYQDAQVIDNEAKVYAEHIKQESTGYQYFVGQVLVFSKLRSRLQIYMM